jgi:2-polyprenyl-3-methyl-5-hydroxy-6-metoxy-1,4-benzoquinol methylase
MIHDNVDGYRWNDAELSCVHEYLLSGVLLELDEVRRRLPLSGLRLFDLGCGNGSVSHKVSMHGWTVVGVDSSLEGISCANAWFPDLQLFVGSAYNDLSDRFGTFPVVMSLEVVEHLFFPRRFAGTVFSLLESGGAAVISTPFHGYWKNLALALGGKMDSHFTALWDYGHIKFWSIDTLAQLLAEAGFVDIRFRRVGRIPALAKSIIAIAPKP